MNENIQKESPFSADWVLFGFNGKPSPGFDYSWFEVQNYMGLIGFDDYIQNCKLFSSSKNSHIFMIRTQNSIEEVWDISDVNFNPVSPDYSVLSASYNDRCIHVSNVSTSFIELLIRAHKLSHDSLSHFRPFTPMQLKIKVAAPQLNIPELSSKIES
ncbi:hypothetical protein M9Y10_012532 [Tritrichomonas musculus]|uniref:Uncharacterized protein n=1 Tax=Tritrichomonas musculus TaxID=1915356 RepID=A0ABR2GK09_9EUKA